tara:strand:+ start:317 stop:1051 length:735 start_codon:yes stop_codon:yes gene_type:complete
MEGMYKRLFFAALLAFSANEASAQWGTVEEITVAQATPTDRDLIRVEVKGLKGDGCQIVTSEVLIDASNIVIDTSIRGNPVAICPAVVVPLDFTQTIGGLEPGTYQVSAKINGEASGPLTEFAVTAANAALTLSPATGVYASNQTFDFTMFLERDPDSPGSNVVSGSAYLSGRNTGTAQRSDVSDDLAQCLTKSELVLGGSVFRCSNISAQLGVGSHTLTVSLQLEDGTQLSDTVLWTVLGAQD